MPRNAMRRIKLKGNRTNYAETSLEPIVKEEDAVDEKERERSRILYIIIIIIIVNFRVLNENVRTISRDTDFS